MRNIERSIKLLACFILLLFSFWAEAQYSRQDTLRGSIGPSRAWWDLVHYHLELEVFPETKSFIGQNTVTYKVLDEYQYLQIDLQEPLKIDRVTQDGQLLEWHSEGAAHFISLRKPQRVGDLNSVVIRYSGVPHEAVRAPWDGGISWKKDKSDNHFIASSCQGIGASIWWPCKDHMYDEVDSMLMTITVPAGLFNVSNGRLANAEILADGRSRTSWRVVNPINNYGVNINIGDYAHFSEIYQGEKGDLTCDYYVLSYNLDKAKEHFKQVKPMMDVFEHWFGPYPFYEDGYKLVEVPYLGMEHQSSVTYGNGYQQGYLGRDLSGTGRGMIFDYLIIHETGHEWFANNITYQDIADMWIHEGFTTYSENLIVEAWLNDKEAGADYVLGLRSNIANDEPIIGPYGVNKSGSKDMYSKGANLLHMIRQVINDDERWRAVLRGLNETFYHKTTTSKEVEAYMIDKSGVDLSTVFDQYLRDTRIPILEYRIVNNSLRYRWVNTVEGFRMPADIMIDGEWHRVEATNYWFGLELDHVPQQVSLHRNYYAGIMSVL